MDMRSSSTMLPPVRRKRRRDWGRAFARIVCVLFALVGLLPIVFGLIVRTSWARDIATIETRKVLARLGVRAAYDIEVHLWPLSLGLRNLRVDASDGGTPVLTATRVTARPKIFGLLSGKLVLDQVEIDQPKARVVLRDGKIANLDLNLPESNKDTGPSKPPFSVISTSEADVDLDIDGIHLAAHGLDADVATDDAEGGGTAFEIALRLEEATSRVVRTVKAPEGDKAGEFAVDEDTLCRLDGRARIEPKRVLVRRLVAYGAVDLDPADDTHLGCTLPRDDKRYVDLGLGHFSVTFPKTKGEVPNLDGHVRARAPLGLLKRLPGAPETDGWIGVDAEIRYTPQTPLPDMSGKFEGHGIRLLKYSFARSIQSDFQVNRSVITSARTSVEIADGVADIRDVEVRPLERGIPLKARLDARDVDFTSLMRDLGVSPHPHVTWDLREVHAANMKGTLDPLNIEGDLAARTQNFGVYDAAVDGPTKTRATGMREASIAGKVGIRTHALEFANITVTTPKSLVRNVFVSIGFHNILKVDVPNAHVDLSELSPLGSVPISGVADVRATVQGQFNDPHLEGDASIQNFVIADLPFGNVTQGHATLVGLAVDLRDVRAVKGKSTYEMPTGKLDFGTEANMRLDGRVTSRGLDVRDFFSIFKLEEDPRFVELGGVLETNARMHLALGGPEDVCKGGFLDVQATTNARDLDIFGEKFDEGHADFEYRWIDRLAGVDGAEIDVRSLSLTKAKKEGKAGLGAVLGSVAVQRGGQLRGSLVLQGFPLGRANMLGAVAPNIEGTVSGIANVSGTLEAFEVEADLSSTPLRIFGAPFGGSDLHVAMKPFAKPAQSIGKTACGGRISPPFDKEAYLRDASVQGLYTAKGTMFGGQVRVDELAVTREKAPKMSGKLAFDGFDLGPLGRMMKTGEAEAEPTSSPLGGEVSGDLTLGRIALDDLAHAKVSFAPRVLKVTRGGQSLALRQNPQAPLVIALENDEVKLPSVTFDIATSGGFNGSFAVSGGVRKITHGGELGLEAQLFPIDLGVLAGSMPRVTRAVGKVSGSVHLGGKPLQPELEGQLAVRGGELAVKGLPGDITDLEVDVVADENEVRISRAVGHFLGGDVALTAQVPFKRGQFGVAQAWLTGRQLYTSPIEGVKATVDADLEVTYNPQAPSGATNLPFVGGDVTITSFEYARPITVDLTGLKAGARRTVVEAYDPTLDAIALGFDVHSRVPLRFRNNLVEAQLAIDPRGIRVTGTNQRVGLRGELTTMSGGHFRLFANDFEIQKGAIRFEDPTRIAPHVDVLATTEYRRYSNTGTATSGAAPAGGSVSSGGQGTGLWRIALHASGDAEDLRVDMTSDPPLSREDIFFLLTIGLTRAEVDQVRSAGSAYAGVAFEAIGTVSGVDRAVKQAIPVIDDFRPGTAYSSRSGRVEPNITVGRRLGENVRARLTTFLAEDSELRSAIEWRLNRTLTVEPGYDRVNTASSSNLGNFGLDFRWRLEFD